MKILQFAAFHSFFFYITPIYLLTQNEPDHSPIFAPLSETFESRVHETSAAGLWFFSVDGESEMAQK